MYEYDYPRPMAPPAPARRTLSDISGSSPAFSSLSLDRSGALDRHGTREPCTYPSTPHPPPPITLIMTRLVFLPLLGLLCTLVNRWRRCSDSHVHNHSPHSHNQAELDEYMLDMLVYMNYVRVLPHSHHMGGIGEVGSIPVDSMAFSHPHRW